MTPNFWTDPTAGIPYYLAVQTPRAQRELAERYQQYAGFDAHRWRRTRVPVPGLLSNVATFKRDTCPTNANQANIQPVYEVYASAQGRDLGSVSSESTRSWRTCRSSCSPAIRSRSSARSRA